MFLRREFKEQIGFYSRLERNHSELVYDLSGGGSYVAAALYSNGISTEQIIHNIAARLREDIKKCKFVPWPLSFEQFDAFMLRDAWTLHNLESCFVCPDVIAKDQYYR